MGVLLVVAYPNFTMRHEASAVEVQTGKVRLVVLGSDAIARTFVFVRRGQMDAGMPTYELAVGGGEE